MITCTFVDGTGVVMGIVAEDPDGISTVRPYIYMGTRNTHSQSKIFFSERNPPVVVNQKWVDGTVKKIILSASFYEVKTTNAKQGKNNLIVRSGFDDNKGFILLIPRNFTILETKEVKRTSFIFKQSEMNKLLFLPKDIKKITLVEKQSGELRYVEFI